MRKYKITDLEEIFEFAEFSTSHIESLPFDIVNKERLSRKGKRKKKEATEGELDLFVYYGNVIWLIEWTTGSGLHTGDFDTFKTKIEILNKNRSLLQKLVKKIEKKFNQKISPDIEEARVIGLYVNPTFSEIQVETLKARLLSVHKDLIYVWDCDTFEYFKVVCGTIRKFSKYELFTYFNISPEFVFNEIDLEGRRGAPPYEAVKIEKGVFGNPTYTFKISPVKLLERCYVLRNEGWRSDSFQRIVIPRKLASIREYIIKTKNTSFANNIIISPSPEIDPSDIIEETKNGKILIHLPFRFSSFCIIDGQHRLLAFTQNFYGNYKDTEKENDKILTELAKKSEIIVTLVKFSRSEDEILIKQATLFKDINSTQTRVKTDFIYNLQEIIEPLHSESIANKTIRYLNNLDVGVLSNKFEIKSLPSYRGRIKRSSIVRWGLRELINTENPFFFSIYKKKVENPEDIPSYVKFCGDKLNKYFSCIKEVFKKRYKREIWDNWRKTGFMLLSTSSIVGFLRLYRHFIKSGLVTNKNKIKNHLRAINVNFKKEDYLYTSSQWAKLEEKMFDDIRSKYSKFGDENLIKRKR